MVIRPALSLVSPFAMAGPLLGSRREVASSAAAGAGKKGTLQVSSAEPVFRVAVASPREGPMSLVTGQHHEAEDKARDKTGAGREGRCGSPSHELHFLASVMWLHIENNV